MFPGSFTYTRPASVAEAVQALVANPDAKILAGGHSLIPAMKLRLAMPGELVDLAGIAELRGPKVNDNHVVLRAMDTYNDVRDHSDIAKALPIFAQAISVIGDAQVRDHGTPVGSLVHNDPAADLTAVALALGGTVHATGPEGERGIDIDEFFIDLWTTALEPEEVVTHVTLNRPTGEWRMSYQKFAHPASGYAIVGVAVVLSMDGDTVASARVALTGVTNTATRLTNVEGALTGSTLSDEAVDAAVSGITDGLTVNGDTFASEEYRAHLAKVLTKRAILAHNETAPLGT